MAVQVGVQRHLVVVLIGVSLMPLEHLFTAYLASLHLLWGGRVRVLAQLLLGCVSLPFSFKKPLSILDNSPFSGVSFANIVSQSVARPLFL